MITELQVMILFVCFTMGAILRTLWGALWKYIEDPNTTWDDRYTMSMIISIVLTFIFAITTFSSIGMPEHWESMHAFGYISMGFTTNTLFNSIVSDAIRRNSKD